MGAAKTFVVPTSVPINPPKSTHPPTPILDRNSSYYQSSNWAGYVSQGGGYTAVTGDWYVPDISSSTETSYSSIWPGIGGDGNDYLIQAGTEQDAYVDIFGESSTYYAWWEMLPDYGTQQALTNFTVTPGDEMYVSISYSPAHSCATYYIEDLSRGEYSDFCALHANNDYSGGPSAEWIVERTEINGNTFPPLANFGTIQYQDATATNSSGQQSAQQAGLSISMKDDSCTLLAEPSGFISSTSFDLYWKAYGQSDPSSGPPCP